MPVVGEPRRRRLLDGGDRQPELAGELEVALVAARHGHDRAGAVAHQHVVGDPHRDRLAVERVGGVRAGEHAGLLAGLVLAVDRPSSLPPACGTRRPRRRCSGVVSASTSGCSGASTMNVAPNSVSGRVVNTVIGPASATRSAPSAPSLRPIQLRCIVLIDVGPVEQVEVVDQAVGVGGDAHHPLAHVALEDREVAAVGAAVGGDLLVGDDGAEAGAPVDRRVADVGQAVAVDRRRAARWPTARPRATVGRGPRADLELGDQLGDRPGPVERRCRTRC